MKVGTVRLLEIIKSINYGVIFASIVIIIIVYSIPFTLTVFLSPDALKALIEADATIVGLFGAISVYYVTSIDQKIDRIDDQLANQPFNWVRIEKRKREIKDYKKSSVRALLGSLLCLVFSFLFLIMALGIQTIEGSTQTTKSLMFAYFLSYIASALLILGVVGVLLIIFKMGTDPEDRANSAG